MNKLKTLEKPNKQPLAAIAIRQVKKSTGASRNAFEQASALVELGYAVTILAERGKREVVERAGAQFVHLSRWPFKGSFRRFWFNRRIQSWCKRHKPDIMISHGDSETNDVVYMHNCVHLASERIDGHGLPQKHEVAAIHDYILSRGKFRCVAVNSKLMADDLKLRYGLSEEKLEISYPGYDPDKFNFETARKNSQAMRQSLDVNEDEYLVGLITSGHFKKRNVAGFIEIAALLNDRLPQRCRFLVVGEGDISTYQRQAKKLGIDSRFSWRTTMPDVERLYGALDVFVFPAHIEEFGRVALEAMACGTPVVLSKWVGAAELISDDFSDLVLDEDNQAWAARIEALLQYQGREELGLRLAERAKEYSHPRQYEKLKASFRLLTS